MTRIGLVQKAEALTASQATVVTIVGDAVTDLGIA